MTTRFVVFFFSCLDFAVSCIDTLFNVNDSVSNDPSGILTNGKNIKIKTNYLKILDFCCADCKSKQKTEKVEN